jgi:hypothetical protein
LPEKERAVLEKNLEAEAQDSARWIQSVDSWARSGLIEPNCPFLF